MVSPGCVKTLHPLQVLLTKSPSSALRSMKIKTLIRTLIVSHMCRIVRALCRGKSILVEILKENQPVHFIYPSKKHKNRKMFFGSFRLHYNWCSSHVLPVTERVFDGLSSTPLSNWNSTITPEQGEDSCCSEARLSAYLHWLEEKVHDKNPGGEEEEEEGINEIDQLAEMFIANCHEQFRLEKQESYRRFQEMMSRSM